MRCAVTVQQRVPELDDNQPPDRAMRFRVGFDIGDAIADGTDLHGDAVNVVQAECPRGGVCVSRSVRDHVHGRLVERLNSALGPDECQAAVAAGAAWSEQEAIAVAETA